MCTDWFMILLGILIYNKVCVSILFQVDMNLPWCTCPDFMIFRLPCKHMMRVAKWGDFPVRYRNCIEFNCTNQLNEMLDYQQELSLTVLEYTEQHKVLYGSWKLSGDLLQP
jgi:hypothetical protein